MMLIVNLGSTSLGIVFEHVRGDNHQPYATKCKLFGVRTGAEPVLLAKGTAKCSYLDNFQKCVGRKIALTRALGKLSTLSKADRKAVWDAYRNRSHEATPLMATGDVLEGEVIGTGTAGGGEVHANP